MTQAAKPRNTIQTDVVVIGAGFAGLSAAAWLVKHGLRVHVLERDIHPGGCAASYERNTAQGTFRFAVGATLATGLEDGGLLDNLHRALEIRTPFTALDPAMRVHLPNTQVQLRGTRQAWQEELQRAFGSHNLAQKQRFWKTLGAIANTMHHVAGRYPVMPWHSLQDIVDTAAGLHPGLLRVLPNLGRTISNLLADHDINDPSHKAFIDGQLLDSMQIVSDGCALPNGAYALEIYRFGAQYVHGGLSSIAENLVRYIQNNGGAVHYATRVKNILVQNGKACGVETNHATFRAESLISSAPIFDTASLLGEHCPPSLHKRVQNLPEVWGAFTMYLGVHENALPKDVHAFEQITDHDANGQLLENFLVSISPAHDTTRAPAQHRAITISTHVHTPNWFGLSKEDYNTKKRQFEQRILARLEALWPGFASHIVCLESGTPKTFQGFTLHSLGRVGGVPQLTSSANFNAQHHTSGVAGLFMAGETIFPGQGTVGVAVSGYNAHRAALRYLKQGHLKHSHSTRPSASQALRQPRRAALEEDTP